MVVLAASVVTKSGKALVSRQYIEMSRIRIEGLLAAFPKLVGTGKQHTYVETDNVRYVYQPMEGLYLLLVTNKTSNIMEDLDTLRLLSKLVPEFAGGTEEEFVSLAAFDLIFAFDEVISLGHKDNLTVQQVKQNCEMESHEEKLHKMIIQSKINETKDVMKRKVNEIEKIRMEQRKVPGGGHMMSAVPSSFGGAGGRGGGLGVLDADIQPSLTAGTFGASAASKGVSKGPSKGMQLGKSSKGSNIVETLAKEGEMVELEPASKGGAAPQAPVGTIVISEPVYIRIEEKLSVILNRDGGLDNLEVQGTMSLVVSSEDDAFVRIAVENDASKAFQFKTHPNIDRNLFNNENLLGFKDPNRPFPTGSELDVLKWRFQSRQESDIPLTINCWPSVSGSESYVNIEYESQAEYDLQNVAINIPMPNIGHAPTVNQVDGEWRYDARQNVLVWMMDLIDDTNRTGSLEFIVPTMNADIFYPIDVSFSANKTFCDIEVLSVTQTHKNAPLKYGFKRGLQTAHYQIS